jgi:hypothetical protein
MLHSHHLSYIIVQCYYGAVLLGAVVLLRALLMVTTELWIQVLVYQYSTVV